MKQGRIHIFILLFSMSFTIVHAFAIDMLDTHECQINEYVQEFSQPISDFDSDDICNIHHGFHMAFIIPINLILSTHPLRNSKPQSFDKLYKYTAYETEIKPPISL